MHISDQYRKPVLVVIILFTLLNGYFLTRLTFDFDIEQLFSKNDPDLAFFQNHLTQFQSDKNYLIVGIETGHGIFNQDFLTRIHQFTLELDSSEYILRASSLTNIKNFYVDPFGRLRDVPFVHPGDPSRYARDSAFLYSYPDVWEKFISSRNTAICLFLELRSSFTGEEEVPFLSDLKTRLAAYGFDHYHLAGDIETENTYVEKLKSELSLLSSLSLLFILVTLYVTFRSVWGVLIPLVIIVTTVCWTMGTLTAFGVSINTLTVIIPSIIIIVSLSDVIHIMSRYKEERRMVADRRMAIRSALRDIGMAILLTSLTTAMGFLTLVGADIQPFIEFGIFTAVGVIYAWILAVVLLPVLLVSRPQNDLFPPLSLPVNNRNGIALALDLTRRHPVKILLLAVMLIGVSVYGISRLRVDSKLYEEMAAGDEYSASLHFFDQHFSGIRPVQIYLEMTGKDHNIFEIETLKRISKLESYLREEYGVESVYSVVTQVNRMNRALHRGRPRYFHLPDDSTGFDMIFQALDSGYYQFELNTILSRDYRSTLIEAKISDLGSYEIGRRNRGLHRFMEETFPAGQYTTRITGKSLLLDKSNEVITRNLGFGLLIAICIVASMMGILFRSVRMVWIALIPNLLPLLMVAGLMGILGTGLKMSTAVIFTIAFGIAVDDTIHFLSRLNTEWKKSGDLNRAIEITYLSTGKAILITSLILILGFGVLLFSSFTTTYITGLFIGITLIFALFSDLLLLPALISIFFRKGE